MRSILLSVPFRRPFGKGPVVLEHTPDHKGKAAGYDHKGVVVLVSFLAETAIDAMEILVLAMDRERRQIQRPAQVGRAPLADVRPSAAHFSGVEGARLQSGIGGVLPSTREVTRRIALGMNRGRERVDLRLKGWLHSDSGWRKRRESPRRT